MPEGTSGTGGTIDAMHPSGVFGGPDSLNLMADTLANPELPDDAEALRHALKVAVMHMRSAAHRLEARASAQRAADARMAKALARLHGVDATNGINPRGFYVYVLWGSDPQTPLYVGQSTNVLGRLGSHLNESAKRAEVTRVTLVRCSDRRTMDRTELRMIRQFRPRWNKVGLGADWLAWAERNPSPLGDQEAV